MYYVSSIDGKFQKFPDELIQIIKGNFHFQDSFLLELMIQSFVSDTSDNKWKINFLNENLLIDII
jgi:hypothetical protein